MTTNTLRSALTLMGFLLAVAGMSLPYVRPRAGLVLPTLVVGGGLVGFFVAFVPVDSTELGDWARARTGLLSRVLLGLLAGIALGLTVVGVVLAARDAGEWGRTILTGVTAALAMGLRTLIRSRWPAPGRDYR